MSSPPESIARSGAVSASAKRPGWVWVITIFYVLSLGFTLFSTALILIGAIPLTPAQQTYFAGLGPVDYFMSVGVSLLSLASTLLLFFLRKAAATLFTIGFVVNIGYSLLHAFMTNWSQAVGGSGLVGAFLGWGILAAVTLYARHLRDVGVLK